MIAGTDWGVGLAQAAIATLATLLTVGVAFLNRPSKATLYWSCAFTLAMVATVGVTAASVNDSEMIRRICLGALIGGPALLWSGFRAYWGVRPFVWIAPLAAVSAAVALVLAGDVAGFTAVYRIVYLVAAGFAVLFFFDWLRFADRRDRLLLPFALISALFGAAGVASAIRGLLAPPTGGDDLVLLRAGASVGLLAYVTCALIAVLGLSVRDSTLRRAASAPAAWTSFQESAGDRLSAAQAAGEQLSMIYLRVDDATEIRQAAGAPAFSDLAERVTLLARSVFPADSEVCPDAGGTFVLVSRPDVVVRGLLSSCLERIARLDVPGRLPIHPSASAGWATASTLGYDLSALILMSREAAILAGQNGGDRWERMSAAVVRRLLTGEPAG